MTIASGPGSPVPEALRARMARLAADRESGAAEIAVEAIALLRDARALPGAVPAVAAAVCRAQPSMAPVWNAALEALACDEGGERFERFAQRMTRAQDALVRVAAGLFLDGAAAPLHVVTLSYSSTVARVVEALARSRVIQVACAEGRPALEGRRLAARLAASDIEVTFFSDAAIGQALGGADAVLVGADAVTPEWFLNKSGTRLLAAAAGQAGVPVYVLATRDKFVSGEIAERLDVREGRAAEIWEDPPGLVTVRNPYFEAVPLDLAASLLTDAGQLGVDMVEDACAAIPADVVRKLIRIL